MTLGPQNYFICLISSRKCVMIHVSADLKREHSGFIILHKVWKVLNQVLSHGFHQTHDFSSNFSANRAFPCTSTPLLCAKNPYALLPN